MDERLLLWSSIWLQSILVDFLKKEQDGLQWLFTEIWWNYGAKLLGNQHHCDDYLVSRDDFIDDDDGDNCGDDIPPELCPY